MCLTLYIGSNAALPEIVWDKDFPRFNTRSLEEWDKKVKSCFSLPEVIYAGSDQSCGCGFRHALYMEEKWIPVVDDEEAESARKNHQQLLDYIMSNVKEGTIELFACWNGDVVDGPRSIEKINDLDLVNDNFYFKEGGFYRVLIKS